MYFMILKRLWFFILALLFCYKTLNLNSGAEPEPVAAGRSSTFWSDPERCKVVKAKTCFLLLFSLFLYEKKPEPVKKKYLEPVKKGPAQQHWIWINFIFTMLLYLTHKINKIYFYV